MALYNVVVIFKIDLKIYINDKTITYKNHLTKIYI